MQLASRGSRVASFAVVLAVSLVTSIRFATTGAQTTDAPVADALDRYEVGEFDPAVRMLQGTLLRAGWFLTQTDAWIAATAPDDRARRTIIAAAFAIDVAWTANQSFSFVGSRWLDPDQAPRPPDPLTSPLFFPTAMGAIVPWAVGVWPEESPSLALDAAWWPAALGLLQQTGHWTKVRDLIARARVRAPSPRWRMVETVARVSRDVPAPRPDGRRDAVLFEEPLGSGALKRASAAVAAFDALRDDPDLGAEADLRAGHLEMRRRHWAEAFRRFDRARARTTDEFLIATASYFEGWVHEHEHRVADAIGAYRRAHAIAPTMRTVATLLAAQLYLTDARAEAYPILEAGLNADPAPVDWLIVLERADARFVPQHLVELRTALRRMLR